MEIMEAEEPTVSNATSPEDGATPTQPRKKTSLGSKSKRKIASCNITNCKYEVVAECIYKSDVIGAQLMGLKITNDDVNYNLFWIDTGVSVERLLDM